MMISFPSFDESVGGDELSEMKEVNSKANVNKEEEVDETPRRRRATTSARVRTETMFGGSTDAPPTENFEFYRAPTQMVHWGEPQILPHTNWFDLFFDLIYVATAFQLGTLLSYNVDQVGITYFLAMFYTMLGSWHAKLSFDSRIDATDGFHKVVDIAEALLVATSALHIEGHLSDIRDLRTHSALGFSISTFSLRCLTALRWHEVAKVGDEVSNEAKTSCRMQRNIALCSCLFYGASVVASMEGFNHNSADLACGIWIVAALNTYIAVPVSYIWISACFELKQHHRIPLHVEYTLHRHGEWVMLMIGESILSLIVGAPRASDTNFYLIFGLGFLCATSMQFIHYYTNPFHADEHALRLSMFNALKWIYSHHGFSASLVAFGVSLKLLLKYHDADHLKEPYAWLYSTSLGTAYVLNQYMASQHKGKAWPSSLRQLLSKSRLSPEKREQTCVQTLQVLVAFAILTLPLWGRVGPQGDDYESSSSYYSAAYSTSTKYSDSSYSSSYSGQGSGTSTSYGSRRVLAGESSDEPTSGLSPLQLSTAGAVLMVLGALLEGLEHTDEVQHGHGHAHDEEQQQQQAQDSASKQGPQVELSSRAGAGLRLAERLSVRSSRAKTATFSDYMFDDSASSSQSVRPGQMALSAAEANSTNPLASTLKTPATYAAEL